MAVSETVTATGYTSSGVDETVTVTGWTSAGNTSGGGYDPNHGSGGTVATHHIPKSCKTPKMRITIKFLEKWERLKTEAYVPPKTGGGYYPNSGVTFGIGVELDHLTAAQINGFTDVKDKVRTKIANYVSALKSYEASNGGRLLGSAAASYISSHPLSISSTSEVTKFSMDVISIYYEDCVTWYNNLNTLGINFKALPENTQTAIFSTYYNLGLKKINAKCPDFVKQIKNGLWKELMNNYLSWIVTGDTGQQNRRRAEGHLIQTDLTIKDYLPSVGDPCSD